MPTLTATRKFWAVETLEVGKQQKKKPTKQLDSVHSVPGSAHARARWIEAHHPIGWYADITVTPYEGDQLKSVLGL